MGLAVIKESVASLDLPRINRELAGAPAEDVVRWALGLGLHPFMSTSFGPNAALMLDLVSGIDSSVPVVWVDTGYNLRDTYVVAEKLMKLLPLNSPRPSVSNTRASNHRSRTAATGIMKSCGTPLHMIVAPICWAL
jgi:3'-phosphoadenosine 5'-phosphosulfate sulfotransferase (PAPS reductase)/FAD synthetase